LQTNTHVDVDAAAILAKIRLQDMRIRLEGGDYDSRKLKNREEVFHAPETDGDPHLF
jgi:hypothetical protein